MSELLPSCGMGGRVSCKSLKPCMHSGRRSVTKGKLGQGASSASRLYCQINRRTLDACRPASSTRIANTVPLLLHLADSIALTTAPLYRVQAWTDGRSPWSKAFNSCDGSQTFLQPPLQSTLAFTDAFINESPYRFGCLLLHRIRNGS